MGNMLLRAAGLVLTTTLTSFQDPLPGLWIEDTKPVGIAGDALRSCNGSPVRVEKVAIKRCSRRRNPG